MILRYPRLRSLILASLLGSAVAFNASSQAKVVTPETPAGKQLSGFLTALNSGQHATMRDFFSKNLIAPNDNSAFYDNMADDHVALFKSLLPRSCRRNPRESGRHWRSI